MPDMYDESKLESLYRNSMQSEILNKGKQLKFIKKLLLEMIWTDKNIVHNPVKVPMTEIIIFFFVFYGLNARIIQQIEHITS